MMGKYFRRFFIIVLWTRKQFVDKRREIGEKLSKRYQEGLFYPAFEARRPGQRGSKARPKRLKGPAKGGSIHRRCPFLSIKICILQERFLYLHRFILLAMSEKTNIKKIESISAQLGELASAYMPRLTDETIKHKLSQLSRRSLEYKNG